MIQVDFMWSLKRSGAHAIERWITAQAPEIVFLNNKHHSRPFSGAKNLLETKEKPPHILIGFEDQVIPEDDKLGWLSDHISEELGDDIVTRHIVVLRNPINLFASRFKAQQTCKGAMPLDEETIEMWLKHARGDDRFPEAVTILYDRWFCEEKYRCALSKALGLEFSDEGLNVLGIRGSSFDGCKFMTNPQNMDVLGRWETMLEETEYIRSLKDPRLRQESEQLFGDWPQDLVEKVDSPQ